MPPKQPKFSRFATEKPTVGFDFTKGGFDFLRKESHRDGT